MGVHAIADFQVLGESDDWIVVDKPAPLIVHPANGKIEPNLLGGVETLLMFEMENGAALSIITRLDRETSGVVLIAKHRDAARDLSRIFERREARKEYLAIVHGWPAFDTWTNDSPILRAGEVQESPIWLRQMVHPEGRECETGFWVERRFERNGRPFAVVRCFPKTGRMHQIRVHLQHSGHPIVGDKLYSGEGAEYLEWTRTGWTPALQEKLLLQRHALHAALLGVPWGGHEVTWQSGLAADLAEFAAG
ncbi:RNA pseudouridine synthase [Luteolibacter sp. LG18]|uniref:RluA family pseudouridine synthase n=1 Tax=Luteolibacter sp. LG18 TaxID=2819286 RepID=UPI002B2BA9F4|nr:RNA pseudouridine synthase [Luteolibacter sp. LG18]